MTLKLLLTGRPRVGKTTLICKVIAALGERAGGFYTDEARDESGRRIGFRITTLNGETGWLARLGSQEKYCLGRYGVDVEELERLGVSAVREALAEREVVVIDEIGPMEMFSPLFRQAVLDALASPKALLATVVARTHPFADRVKSAPGIRLITVTPENRNELPAAVLEMLAGRRPIAAPSARSD